MTSSGKTEIYIHLIDKTLREGRQVLYLLPEIALTVQIMKRLRNVFGDRLGIYHSKYSDAERVEIWNRQLSDHPYGVILGARSSLFLPFTNLGLVISSPLPCALGGNSACVDVRREGAARFGHALG